MGESKGKQRETRVAGKGKNGKEEAEITRENVAVSSDLHCPQAVCAGDHLWIL